MRFKLLIAPLAMASATFGASIDFVDLYRTGVYSQTTAAQPSTATGYFLSANVFLPSAGSFNGGTFTPAGGAANALSLNGTVLRYGSAVQPTLSAFNTVFPTGTYSYTATDSTNANPNAPQTVGVNYTGVAAFAAVVPFVTNYNSLNGLNPLTALSINWNSFTGALANSFVFLTITNHATSAVVVNQGFLASNTTSSAVAGGTFQANTVYDFTLVFSNRQTGTYSSGSATFAPTLGFDVDTNGSFTTGASAAATPEPSTLLAVASGLAFLLARRRRVLP